MNWLSFIVVFSFAALSIYAYLYHLFRNEAPVTRDAFPGYALDVRTTPSESIKQATEAKSSSRSIDLTHFVRQRVGFRPRLQTYLIDWAAIYLGVVLAGILGGVMIVLMQKIMNASWTNAGSFEYLNELWYILKDRIERENLLVDHPKEVFDRHIVVLGAIAAMLLARTLLPFIFMIWEGLTGAALGKRMRRIRIQRADGGPALTDRLLLRAAIKYTPSWFGLAALLMGLQDNASISINGWELLSTLSWIAFLILIGGGYGILIESWQTAHDWAAGTAVFPEERSIKAATVCPEGYRLPSTP